MEDRLTIVLHDWDGSDEAEDLARLLAEHPDHQKTSKIAVVSRKEAAAAGERLGSLGFATAVVPDGASPGKRKNVGIDGVRGDVLLLSVYVRPVDEDWLRIIMQEADSIEGVGVAGCKVVDASGRIVNTGSHVLRPGYDLMPLGGGKQDINQYYYTREVEGVDSRCMFIRAEVLNATCEFDERYTSGYDDIDFCLKAKAKGLKVVCVGSTSVISTLGQAPRMRQDEMEDIRSSFKDRWMDYFRDHYETKVMWHSWINAPTGYAISSQYLVLALEALNIDVRYGFVYGVEEPPNDDERIMEVRRKPKDLEITQVVYGQGDVFFKNSGKYRIGYSMLEVTGIPADWVEQANALDEIWVPSHFNKETFTDSGVKRPVKVMPLGVDINYFHPFIKSRMLDSRFVFMSVFEWGERKAPEILLRAYNQEFSSEDDVLLLLKVINTDPSVNVERQVDALRLRPQRAPIVIVQNHNVPSYQMGSLYCSSDCFVLPTRGEGWGMPTLEAMACGLPVISTYWSAQTEFFNEEVGYPIRTKDLIPAVAKCPYYEGFKWADPDVDHLASLMRHVFENREEARAKGLRASIAVRDKWTWLHAAERIKKRLLEIAG